MPHASFRVPGGPRPRRSAVLVAVAALAVAVPAGSGWAAPAAPAEGTPSPFTLRDPRLTESSGLAASRAHPDTYWTHNDSDDGPYVYAVDGRSGRTVATVTLSGITPRDVEAVSVGPDGAVYVADIGDNLGGTWSEVWIYRFAEPDRLADTTVTPARHTVRYADGPRDAEALMVHPRTGRAYIASKEDGGEGGVYAGPEKLSTSGVNTFQRVAGTDVEVTDGAFSPDGTRMLLRGYFRAQMYRWTAEGRPKSLGRVAVPFQRQGESVTFARDGRTVLFGSEGEESEVRPEGLEGELLPEDVAARDRADGKGGGSGGSGGSGEDRRDPDGAEDGESGHLLLGALVLALVYGVWSGLRRRFRRRG